MMPTPPHHRLRRLAAILQIGLFVCWSIPLWAGGAGSSARLKMSDLQAIDGDVLGYAVSPDGSQVVYIADPDINGIEGLYSVPADGGSVMPLIVGASDLDNEFLSFSSDGTHVVVNGLVFSDLRELFSVPVIGGAVVRLNPPLPDFGTVREFVLAGTRAIYWGDQNTLNTEELFSVPITGGTAVRINGELTSGEVEDDYRVSPDESRILYRARQDGATVRELYSAPVDASSAAVRINDDLASGDVTNFVFSPDSARVVYRAAQDTPGVFELYSAPIDGSAVGTKISGTLVMDGDVSENFFIDPSSSRVVYQADQDTDAVDDLYSVPLTGGMVTKLTDTFVADGALITNNWTVSAQHVAFVADRDTDEVFELFTVPIDGGTVTKVSGPLVAEGDVNIFDVLAFTGNGSRIIYAADQVEDGIEELFSSLVAGGGNVKLSDTLAEPSGLRSYGTFGTSSVWYQAEQDVATDIDLYRVPADGSAPAEKVNGTLTPGGDVRFDPIITATRIFYTADQDTLGVNEIYSADLSGGMATKLNGPITALGGRIENVLPTPDGQRVIYRGGIENRDRDSLFSTEIATGVITPLALPIADGAVEDEQLSFDGTRVVYSAPVDARGVEELYSVPIEGGEAIRLNSPFVDGGDVCILRASPSTDRVVYLADQEVDGVDELYSVPISGGPVVKLNDPLPPGGQIFNNEPPISSSGSTTIYRGEQNVDGVTELFAAPMEGGPIVDLTAAMTNAVGPIIAPDESRVVYLADEETQGNLELYSAPLGGGPSVKLAGGVSNPTTGGLQVTSDSAFVVYRGGRQLFSVPIAGGEPTRLNADLPTANAAVDDFLITPDGTHVVYRADQDAHNVQELYSVPVTGGAPVKLNPSLPPGGDVLRYKISPTGDRVAFNGDVETNGISDLFSVPVEGGTAVKLNGTLAGSGTFSTDDFEFTADGRWVVYRAEEDTDEVDEVYLVRSTGGRANKVNGPLVPGGSVREFWMGTELGSVFYTADEELLGVRDLWLGRPLIFADGFESGDISAWSENSTP